MSRGPESKEAIIRLPLKAIRILGKRSKAVHRHSIGDWQSTPLRVRTCIHLTVAAIFLLGACACGQDRASIYSQLLKSTALIQNGNSQGSGWVIDRQRKLLITNFHVVYDAKLSTSDGVIVIFPVYQGKKPIAERSYYQENRAALIADGRAVIARVIDANPKIDLALLEADRLPADVTELKLAAESADPGAALHSIGSPGDSDALWHYTQGHVKQVSKKVWRSRVARDFLRFDMRVVETQAPTNPGDSGGPVVNDQGELVAVTQGGSASASLLNLAIDVSEVRKYLTEVGWMANVRTPEEFSRRAERYLKVWRQDFALQDINAALRLAPDNPNYYVQRATILLNLHGGGRRDVDILELLGAQSRERFPLSTGGEGGRYEKAIDDCNVAIRLNPNLALAYARRGEAFHGMRSILSFLDTEAPDEKGKQTLADCEKALKLDPNCASAYRLLGNIFAFSSDPRGIEYLTEAIRLESDNDSLYSTRASAHLHRGNTTAALADLDAAIKLNPTGVHHLVERADFYESKFRDLKKALADLSAAIELYPERISLWEDRAEFGFRHGQYDLAIHDCTKCLELIVMFKMDETTPLKYLELRGDAFAKQGDRQRALEDYGAALQHGKPSEADGVRIVGKAKALRE